MKYFIYLCIVFILAAPLFAEGLVPSFGDNMKNPGLHKKSISVFSGINNTLFGYEDERFVGDDKGDYLETAGSYYGSEFYMTGFGDSGVGRDLRFGINTNTFYRGGYPDRTLYAIPSMGIEEYTIISDDTERSGKLYNYTGFFFGLDRYMYGIDLGLTAGMRLYYEEKRERYQSDGTIAEENGRGWIMDRGDLQINMLFRIGPENLPHFVFERYRENYDPVYGNTIAKIVFPVNSYFRFAGGGTLDGAASIFIEPSLMVNGFGLSLRGGSYINYYDDKLKRVGLQDTLYCSFSLFKEW